MEKAMQTAEVIDYAKPLMEAERALKNMHDAALHRDYEMAKEFAVQAMTHTRLAMHSCSIMAENNPWERVAA
jgi:hypothetical protein